MHLRSQNAILFIGLRGVVEDAGRGHALEVVATEKSIDAGRVMSHVRNDGIAASVGVS